MKHHEEQEATPLALDNVDGAAHHMALLEERARRAQNGQQELCTRTILDGLRGLAFSFASFLPLLSALSLNLELHSEQPRKQLVSFSNKWPGMRRTLHKVRAYETRWMHLTRRKCCDSVVQNLQRGRNGDDGRVRSSVADLAFYFRQRYCTCDQPSNARLEKRRRRAHDNRRMLRN